MERVPVRYVISQPAGKRRLARLRAAVKKQTRAASRRGFSLFRRPLRGRPMLLALGVSLALHFSSSGANAPPAVRPPVSGSFVKDSALARLLGETLFHDTVDVMSDP